MRIVFFGSAAFAIPSFEACLDAGHEVAALVTQPDRGKGRGRSLAPPPLKPIAEARGVRVLQPPRVRDPEAQRELLALRPELQVVVAYGQRLPRELIELPRLGTLNVHASLLPRYRGAAPIQWAIAEGETETGVTTMRIDEGLDTGPILLARAVPIAPDDTAAALEQRLAPLGAALLIETLRGLASGNLEARPQDHARATRAPLLRKEDGRIDWTLPAASIERRVRAFQPWPGSVTRLRGAAVKVTRTRLLAPASAPPGTILGVEGDALAVACGSGTRLGLLELQPEGRRPMSGAAFAAGARLTPGERFG